MKGHMKKKYISIRVSDEEKEEIQRNAKKEGRSVSNYVLWMVQKYFEKKT